MLSKFVWPLNSDSVHQLCWQSFQPAANDPSLMSLPGRSPNGSDQRQGTNSRRIHDAVFDSNQTLPDRTGLLSTAPHRHASPASSAECIRSSSASRSNREPRNRPEPGTTFLPSSHGQAFAGSVPEPALHNNCVQIDENSPTLKWPRGSTKGASKKSIPVAPVWVRYPQPATGRQAG